MSLPEILRLSFSDLGAFEREIATNLRYGRLFVSDVLDAPVLSEGMLVLVHPVDGSELHLAAQIVMVNSDGPMRGTGLALRSFGPTDVERVMAFAREHAAAASDEDAPQPEVERATPPPAAEDDWSEVLPPMITVKPGEDAPPAAVTLRPGADSAQPPPEATIVTLQPPAAEPEVAGSVTLRPGAESAQPPTEDPEAHIAAHELAEALAHAAPQEPVAEDDWSGVLPDEPAPEPAAVEQEAAPEFDESEDLSKQPGGDVQRDNRQERLRTLNVTEQLKIARRGELQDRVVIERLYGKQVWEALLQNPRITLPEVARIARKGTVPRPLIESIVENTAWIKDVNVRRALLSNNKMTSDGIQKLLRITPKHELKTIEKGTAFPMAVRDAAKKLLKES
ncbi:MAG TPA: hypothetical protein VJR89_37090 [Polyangiales bacterium]|nr:hypothetical protein [Polyangiales bacterium]